MSLVACAVAARYQLPQARALARSLRLLTPPVRLSVLLVDDREFEVTSVDEPFSVVRPHELDTASFEVLAGIHVLGDLVDVVRPALLRHALEHADGPVLSLDVDALAFASLSELTATARRHPVVLVPRLLAAVPDDRVRVPDEGILDLGVFDQALCAMSAGDEVDHFLRLWSDRLEFDEGTESPPVTARMLDLVPGLIGGCAIVRDPGLGVSSLNLHERRITREPGYCVNGRPLRLAHLAGLDGYQLALDDRLGVGPGRPEPGDGNEVRAAAVRRRSVQRELVRDNPALGALVAEPERLGGCRVDDLRGPEYAYARLADGTPLTRRLRGAIRDADRHRALVGSPFSAEGTRSLLDWCNAPAPAGGVTGVSRFWHEIYLERTDLQASFPDLDQTGAAHYRRWILEQGRRDYGVPDDLVPAMALS